MIKSFPLQNPESSYLQVHLYNTITRECFILTSTIATYCPRQIQQPTSSSLTSFLLNLLSYFQYQPKSQASFLSYASLELFNWFNYFWELFQHYILSGLIPHLLEYSVYHLQSWNNVVTSFSVLTTFCTTVFLLLRRLQPKHPKMAGFLGGGGGNSLGAVGGLTRDAGGLTAGVTGAAGG